METVTNTTDFSDCNHADFTHYFAGTAMVWTLPGTSAKRRVFLVNDLTHDAKGVYHVVGQYLTKLKEWKTKQIKFDNWYKVLEPVAIRDMYFHCGKGVSLYQPNLTRASGALKKSVRWNYTGFTHYGNIAAEDISTQGITWWAFHDLYEASTATSRTLADILLSPDKRLEAEVSAKGFIVDRGRTTMPRIYHRNRALGDFQAEYRCVVPRAGTEPFMKYMQQIEGLRSHGITIKGAS